MFFYRIGFKPGLFPHLFMLTEQLIISEGREEDILILARLADALQVATPSMAPYLEEPR